MMKKNESKKKAFRLILNFAIIIAIIFLIALLLSWENITRFFARLGLVPPITIMGVEEEFTYTIPSSELQAGESVAYYSFANDTSGNWNETNRTLPLRTFIVIYPEDITSIEILDFTGAPAIPPEIPQGQAFSVQINITNDRASPVFNPKVTYQIKNPDDTVTMRVASSSPAIHDSGQDLSFSQGFDTAGYPKGTYTVEGRVITNWAMLGGFRIAYTETTTFDVV